MDLYGILEPIADWFAGFNTPEPIVHWGHPAMMAVVLLFMGSFVGLTGWKGRLATDTEVAVENRSNHRKIAPWMFLFIALGYTGGLLSLVMQHHSILESPHFWTGSVLIALLAFQGVTSLSGFWGKQKLRSVHAYLGSVTLTLMLVHAILGFNLGVSL